VYLPPASEEVNDMTPGTGLMWAGIIIAGAAAYMGIGIIVHKVMGWPMKLNPHYRPNPHYA
jgi:hypothetical protein